MSKVAIVVVSALLLFTGGCKKASVAKYKARALALVAKYSPKVAEYSKQLPDLAKHAKDLPVNIPGADKLGKLLADNDSTVKSAQGLLADLPNKIGADSPEQAEKDLAEAEKTLAADDAKIAEDEKEEKDIEDAGDAATAAGSAAPAAGSAVPAAGSAGSAAPAAGSAAPAKK